MSKLPLHNAIGQVCGLLGVFEDITEKKQIDDALRESMAAMNETQRIARMGSWRLELETNRMVWSDELRRMSGLAPGQPLPSFEERQKLYLPESRQKLHAGIAEIRKTGGQFSIEVEVLPTGHEKRCMLVTGEAERDAQGTVVALYGTAQDITEQKSAAEALRASARRFRLQAAALEATINVVVITDAQGTIEWVNPAFTRVTGYTLAEAVGQNPRILRSGQQPKQYYAEMWRTIRAGQSWSGEFVNVRKDGGLFTEEVTITPVRAEGGIISHYVAVKQDITEKRSLEKQLIETQRLESIGLLASGIAHDLNNIIAPITLSMELLRHKYPNDQRTLEMVEQCARRGADVVRQVLTFSRGMDGTRVPLRVSRLVKEMGHLMSETLPRNIEFSCDVNTPEDTVRADHTQIHQVILNLGVNARDAMPQGGKLTYTLTNETLNAEGPGSAGATAPGPYLVIAVADTGTGIPPEVLPRIFEPFFTTKAHGKGTGLGLSTVHGIVRSHGGFIKVQSTVGVGTTFKVYLPLVTQSEVLGSNASGSPFGTGEGRLVIVADDEPTIRDTARMVLEAQGYKVLTAENGLEAVTLFQAHRREVQYVLLDRMMPGMNGDDAARAIHHLEPRVPIILATGLVTEKNLSEQAEELKAVGITSVLRKPFTARELLHQLNK
jgi:PAS domain S-box-containing protein